MPPKARNVFSLATKKEILAKFELGITVTDLAKEYEISQSTISTIVHRDRRAIENSSLNDGDVLLSPRRTPNLVQMENLLLVWINELEMAGDLISQAMIQAKAQQIHQQLEQDVPGNSSTADFKASRGWFEKFKKRTGIHNVKVHGEAASADAVAATEFVRTFKALIEKDGYVPQQVFNCDETGLFWKQLPRRTYITREEQSRPGHKAMKDRLTLLLAANARGDLKIKPLLVYKSETPRSFRAHRVNKDELGVLWRSNQKAWVTKNIFVDWLTQVFIPDVKAYLLAANLPVKALLVLDNAPGHPKDLDEYLNGEHAFLRVVFLPPRTTPILQPMDQQVIATFKKLYLKSVFTHCLNACYHSSAMTLRVFWTEFNILQALRLIVTAWDEVSVRALKAAWRPLWPSLSPDSFRVQEEPDIVSQIVATGQTLELEMDTDDVLALIEERDEDLTLEDLTAMYDIQQASYDQELNDDRLSRIRGILEKWQDLQADVRETHQNPREACQLLDAINTQVFEHYRDQLR